METTHGHKLCKQFSGSYIIIHLNIHLSKLGQMVGLPYTQSPVWGMLCTVTVNSEARANEVRVFLKK